MLLVVYVDDLIFGGPEPVVRTLISKLAKRVDLKTTGGLIENVLGERRARHQLPMRQPEEAALTQNAVRERQAKSQPTMGHHEAGARIQKYKSRKADKAATTSVRRAREAVANTNT